MYHVHLFVSILPVLIGTIEIITFCPLAVWNKRYLYYDIWLLGSLSLWLSVFVLLVYFTFQSKACKVLFQIVYLGNFLILKDFL